MGKRPFSRCTILFPLTLCLIAQSVLAQEDAGQADDVVECNACLMCFMPAEEPGMTCAVNDDI